ncbi:hypothetical protein MAPG_08638, partial [Magnaporthiopsis poae ATCC 64411]
MAFKPNMESQAIPQPAGGPGVGLPEEMAPPLRPRKIPISPQVPSPPESDEDGASTDAEDGSASGAGDPGTARALPSKPQGNSSPQRRAPSMAGAPAAADTMMLVSESKLREMMRQEVENILNTIQPYQRTAFMPETKPPLPSVCETRPSQSGPSQPLAPFQASVADAPETATPSPNMPTSPVARHASVSSTTRTGSFSGTAPSPRSPTLPPPTTQSSVSDEKWGRLFDQNGQPTARAEEVFKSVADHIIAELAPRKSIVVTPEKLAEFYAQHGLPNELFPFANMFRPRAPEYSFFERVSDLYDEPTRTRRLAGIVLQVPLSVANTADGKLERMPRLISRGLLPQQPDIKARKILDEALKDFIEDSETIPAPSPSGSRFSGLQLNIPASSASRLPAAPMPPHRDPNRYKPTRDQHYPDRGGGSTSSRRDSRGSGHMEAVDWSPDGHSGYHSRHGSTPLSPTTERDKASLPPQPQPPPPPASRRTRSPQTRRHSHTAVNVMQAHPPTPMAGGTEYAAQLPPPGGLLSPNTTYPSSGGGPMPSSPTTLSPEQLATIRDRSPRHGSDKDYYSLQRQS